MTRLKKAVGTLLVSASLLTGSAILASCGGGQSETEAKEENRGAQEAENQSEDDDEKRQENQTKDGDDEKNNENTRDNNDQDNDKEESKGSKDKDD